jgi:regulator of sigma E protease
LAEFLSHPIPAVVLMLGLLVFVHELGHYLVGRWAGIAVEVFSIGFGPKILGWRHRGTDYRLSWLPLGGFVKFAGVHSSEDVPEGLPGIAFRDAPLLKRALTIFAGPFANFLLAIAAYSVLGMDGIPHPPPVIGEVLEKSAAAAAGIQPGDRFVEIDGRKIDTWRDLEKIISASPGKKLDVTVERGGAQRVVVSLTPAAVEAQDILGKSVTIGRAGIALGKLPPIVAVTEGNSAAARAGLKTGDRVLAIVTEQKTWETPSMPDLVQALEAVIAGGGANTVQLKVAPEAAKDPKDTAVLFLDLAPARDRPALPKGREALRALGIADAQLAVQEATESLASVLRRGDVLTHWEGKPLANVFALREALMANQSPVVKATVVRDFQPLELELPLKPVEAQKPEGIATIYMLPVLFWGQPEEPPPVIEKYDGIGAALGYGLRETLVQTRALGGNVASLVTGDIPLKALGGPMLIAKVAGDSARRGWQTFLGSMALISINLGLLNLFPIPVLDGGQLVLMGAEAVRRRPLRESSVENFQKVGFAMILALVVLATYNDLSRFWKSMLESVVGIFQ